MNLRLQTRIAVALSSIIGLGALLISLQTWLAFDPDGPRMHPLELGMEIIADDLARTPVAQREERLA